MAKKQSFAELTSQGAAKLQTQLKDLRKEQMNLRFQRIAGSLTNFNRWREVRKTIARVKTALNVGSSK